MATTMVPDASPAPDVFPTERLLDNGMCRPELRQRPATHRRRCATPSPWPRCGVGGASIIGGAVWLDRWWAYLAAFVLMGPMYARFAILMHEAAHKLLFTNKRVNDWVGTWFLAYPTWTPISIYRRGHFAHHKEEFGPGEPGHRLLRRLPVRPARARPPAGARRGGHLGLEELHPAVQVPAVRSPSGRARLVHPRRCRWSCGPCCGRPPARWWIYPLLWWLPWMTQWRVINRLRAIAEHGGLEAGRRPAGDHPQRAPDAGSPGSGSCPTTPGGTWPTTSTWESRGATSRPSTPSWSGRGTSPTGSPTPTTAPCGRPWRRPERLCSPLRSVGRASPGSADERGGRVS